MGPELEAMAETMSLMFMSVPSFHTCMFHHISGSGVSFSTTQTSSRSSLDSAA